MSVWEGKHLVLGVTGGIAAYKAVEIVSRLRKAGAHRAPSRLGVDTSHRAGRPRRP